MPYCFTSADTSEHTVSLDGALGWRLHCALSGAWVWVFLNLEGNPEPITSTARARINGAGGPTQGSRTGHKELPFLVARACPRPLFKAHTARASGQ